MSEDRMNTEFCCIDCNEYYDSASNLLTHFALHATQSDKTNESFICKTEKKCVPDLYPINMLKFSKNIVNTPENDSKLNNDFNPLKYCSISMETKDSSFIKTAEHRKKYPCTFCSKIFGWSTDLKRHLLIHTGERPFKCKLCDASFTRNFLLQKHENKIHLNKIESKTMPSLKPVDSNVFKSSRKQDKRKIKRKCFYDSKNDDFFLHFVENTTVVQ